MGQMVSYTWTMVSASIDFENSGSARCWRIFVAFLSSFEDCLGPVLPCSGQQFQLRYLDLLLLRKFGHLHTLSNGGHRIVLGCSDLHLFTGRMRWFWLSARYFSLHGRSLWFQTSWSSWEMRPVGHLWERELRFFLVWSLGHLRMRIFCLSPCGERGWRHQNHRIWRPILLFWRALSF